MAQGVPGSLYVAAQRYRRAAREPTLSLFARFDALLAPSTPCAARPLGAKVLHLNGRERPLRASIGLLTQPLSCLRLPVAAALRREDVASRVAAYLERAGVARAAGENPEWT